MKAIQELIDLNGKAAIVTGGAKGIGKAIAYRLAEAGAKVLVADIDAEAAKQTADELLANGWSASDYVIDISREEAVAHMVTHAKATFGSLDILVNNAGIYPPKPVMNMSSEDFEKVLHVNLKSTFLTTKYAAEIMKEQGGGKIINITSIDALHPSMIGLAHYDASKHGMWGFTKNSALELAKYNIQVNAIAPGSIHTPGTEAMASGSGMNAEAIKKMSEAFNAKIPMGRAGDPDEIGTVALFLASDMASYMTGSQMVVDGGILLT